MKKSLDSMMISKIKTANHIKKEIKMIKMMNNIIKNHIKGMIIIQKILENHQSHIMEIKVMVAKNIQ